MLLLANGCSHTAGAEIEKPRQGHCYEKAWPKLLADKLNYDHINLSESGASCDRVYRTTLHQLHVLRRYSESDPSKIFCIVMWPGMWRTEMFQKEPNEPGFFDRGWMPMVVGNEESYKKQTSKLGLLNYKSWVSRATLTSESTNYFKNVIGLQNILVRNKIKYLFLNSCVTIGDVNQHEYIYEVYKKRFFGFMNGQLSYTNILQQHEFEFGENSTYAHYGEDAQEWFADFLKSYITKNKLL